MTAPARQETLYDQLRRLPEGLTGEIIDGQLYTEPRPSGPHAYASSALAMLIGPAYGYGRGGPGGWWLIYEPEVHFEHNIEVRVPDLAGWRRERMPELPDDQRFEVVTDWVCEVLSPATASKDRDIKMPLNARYGVSYLWLIDPRQRRLEAYELHRGDWMLLAELARGDTVGVKPFDAITFDLDDLWGD